MLKRQINHRRRIIELIKEADTTHIGSALSVVDIIDAIYKVKKKKEKFILSNGHAAAALYVILESYGIVKDPKINILGVHPERNPQIDIHLSTGSLGQGLPVAVGMAMADRSKNVYCSISDGECAEGSIWEAVSVASKYKLNNLKIVVNANGYAGYEEINSDSLKSKFHSFDCDVVDVNGHNIGEIIRGLAIETKTPLLVYARTNVEQLPFLKGLSAHYYKMTEEDYKLAIKTWSKN